jgi:hypothetical protein
LSEQFYHLSRCSKKRGHLSTLLRRRLPSACRRARRIAAPVIGNRMDLQRQGGSRALAGRPLRDARRAAPGAIGGVR